MLGGLDAPVLGQPEIGALPENLGPDLAAGDPDRVVRPVADLVVGLGGGAHIGADAAEIEEPDLGLEDGGHDLAWSGLRGREAEHRLRLRR